jgi:hypothetical protein
MMAQGAFLCSTSVNLTRREATGTTTLCYCTARYVHTHVLNPKRELRHYATVRPGMCVHMYTCTHTHMYVHLPDSWLFGFCVQELQTLAQPRTHLVYFNGLVRVHVFGFGSGVPLLFWLLAVFLRFKSCLCLTTTRLPCIGLFDSASKPRRGSTQGSKTSWQCIARCVHVNVCALCMCVYGRVCDCVHRGILHFADLLCKIPVPVLCIHTHFTCMHNKSCFAGW